MPGPGRTDALVLLGLVGAVVVTALRPLEWLAGGAASRLTSLVLAALPGLIVTAAVWWSDRARTQAAAAALDARAATAERGRESKAIDADRLFAFSRALGRAVDAGGVGAALATHLAPLSGTPAVCVLVNRPAGWEPFAGDRHVADALLARVNAADGAVAGVPTPLAGADAGFPLRAGGQMVGLLVVGRERQALDPGTLHLLEAAAAVLAVTVRSLLLLGEMRETRLRDALTGCLSRAHGLEIVDAELRRARRSQAPVSLVLVDVDHLKSINTRYGHACGDAVLAMVGRRLREVLRRSDVKCRYGGEEFIVLLPETSLLGARRVAETIRREIAHRPVPWNGDAIPVTASFGVTQALAAEVSVDAVIARAAAAVKRAQDEGHNAVRVAGLT